MNITQIKELTQQKEYDFLRTNPHLQDRIIFLTLGGSYSYGTNVETSDVDIRGCALNSRSDLLGLSSFEQVVSNETDTTVYSFKKLIQLLMNCNPNTIEMLGCKPEHYFYITGIGQEMIDNRKLFLSQKAVYSFGGYANQQLRRLENAIARDALPQGRKEEHIKQAMESAMSTFADKYSAFQQGSIRLYTDDSPRDDLNKEVFADITLTKFPARDFQSVLNEFKNVLDCYERLNHRNKKKDSEHLNKHAMHLIRLYLMCLDILENGDIHTYRGNDKEFLLEIRNGKYMREDGTYRDEFFQMVNDYEKRLQYAKANTGLPQKPNYHAIEEFVMSVNRRAINDYFT